jgi:hypothetical protein
LSEKGVLDTLPGTSSFVISRSPSLPSLPPELIFIDIETDMSYLQYFEGQYAGWIGRPLVSRHKSTLVTYAAYDWDFNFRFQSCSPLYRAALLTLASGLRDGEIRETWEYFAHFYEHAKRAITTRSLWELAEASEIIVIYSLTCWRDMESVLTNYRQYCRCIDALFEQANFNNPAFEELENAWKNIFTVCSSADARLGSDQKASDNPQSITVNMHYAHGLIEASSCLLNFDKKTIRSRPKACARVIRMLSRILTYQTQYYLSLLARPENQIYPNYEFKQWVDQAAVQLVGNLDKLIDVILHYPSMRERIMQIDLYLTNNSDNFESLPQQMVLQSLSDAAESDVCKSTIQLFLTYYFTRLLKGLLGISDAGSDDDTRVMNGAAYVLCYIITAAVDKSIYFQMRYTLHYAGLILTKAVSPQGILTIYCFNYSEYDDNNHAK